MRNQLIILFYFIGNVGIFAQTSFDSFIKDADSFYSQYVEDGAVKYQAIKKSPEELTSLIETIEDFNLAGLSDQHKISFYINAYNLTVIKSIIDSYPLASPNEVGGLFDQKKHKIARVQFTLNELEHKKLFALYPDSRYHFVLVCAAKGCPQITNFAYVPSKLEEQLNQQTRQALNDPTFIQIDEKNKKAGLSRIFQWYTKDFTSKNVTLIEYVNQYRDQPIPSHFKAFFYDYDWTLNDASLTEIKPITSGKIESGSRPKGNSLQSYTPSVLLKKGQLEGTIFNNLYTQRKFFDQDSKRQPTNNRSNFFTSSIQFTYGVSTKFNAGLDVIFRSTSNRALDSSPLDVFRFQNNRNARTGITEIGLRAKYAPFNVKGLSFQSILYFPTGKRLQGEPDGSRPYIDFDAIQWFQQLFYDKSIGTKVNLFGELTFITRIDSQNEAVQSSGVTVPIKVFPSVFLTDRFTVYAMTEWAPTLGNGFISSFYLQSGLGAKYQLTKRFEVEALYTNFWFGMNSGAGQTYNIGIRYLY